MFFLDFENLDSDFLIMWLKILKDLKLNLIKFRLLSDIYLTMDRNLLDTKSETGYSGRIVSVLTQGDVSVQLPL